MIQFKELRITPDKKHLIIECNITNSSYYLDMYINLIIIDTLNTYTTTGPSSKAIRTINYDTENKVVREVIDIDSINNNIFFVYVIASGELSDNTPCGMKNTMALGVTFDKEPIYTKSMLLINELEGCNIPRNCIDYMLKVEAFLNALHIGEYSTAIKYWNEFFVHNSSTTISNCNCYGRI